MLRTIEKIVCCNKFRLSGEFVTIEQISEIYEGYREVALNIWEQYERQKAKLLEESLTLERCESACCQIAKILGA
ncbi:adenylate cyclase [Photorhabdus luminescens subsp. luminescens]|uniref:Adenylate cyclase n=1 Tax=Photorhabdus luminescens TaxID=29488 RepID=A0A1G5Q312_PHOLU|nr:hypothetical protein [Photorhabdus antumapuensis]KMW73677.1 adenylate cyclase [Photorhabdus luminescens subsp. luminescens]MCA6222415.1 hypothetical protein [Photorhabdus antumapuensis]SCZ55689.1 hypothetical protein SAMN02982990_00796 [Photorhabdus luminescens]